MTPRKLGEYVLGVIVLILLGGLVMGQVLGQPVLLSYVETGSMAPTLQPGDGFIAVPIAIAGSIERGDVITFEAQRLNGGGLTTHRVVGRTGDGYVTKGDANPTTDQDGTEPPVQRPQIVAKAMQVGGTLVVIPKIGLVAEGIQAVLAGVQRQLATLFNTRALLGTQGLVYLLLLIGFGTYAASEWLDGDSRRRRTVSRRRDAIRGELVVLALTAVVLIFVTASMVVPAGTTEFGVVSSTADAPGPGVIPAGTSESFGYRVPSNGVLPVVVFLEPASDGIDVQPRRLYVPPNSVRTSIVELSAPATTGHYRRYLVEHRYLAVLPIGVVTALYEVHPWLPIVVIDALVGFGFAGVGLAVLGSGTSRFRSRELPLGERIRRRFR